MSTRHIYRANHSNAIDFPLTFKSRCGHFWQFYGVWQLQLHHNVNHPRYRANHALFVNSPTDFQVQVICLTHLTFSRQFGILEFQLHHFCQPISYNLWTICDFSIISLITQCKSIELTDFGILIDFQRVVEFQQDYYVILSHIRYEPCRILTIALWMPSTLFVLLSNFHISDWNKWDI